jgi:hypothetical protein
MDTFVNPLKISVRSVGSIVKSMPDNFVDGVAKMSGGIRSIPNNMLDGVGKILNVKGVRVLWLSFSLSLVVWCTVAPCSVLVAGSCSPWLLSIVV